MEYQEDDIIIRLKMEGDQHGTDAKDIIQAFGSLETALYESDRKDIEDLLFEGIISKIIAHAVLERLRQYRNNRLQLRSAENGSIILEGVIAAVPLYLLKLAIEEIEEIAKEEVRNTQTYKKVKIWFKQQIRGKASFISNAIQDELASKNRRFDIERTNEGRKIELTFKESREKRVKIPSIGEELRNS